MKENEVKEFYSFFKTVKAKNECDKCMYTTRLDLYGCGCAHDCRYCYAKSLLDFRNLWNAKNPRVANIEKVRRKIDRLKKGSVVRLGGMTDDFQYVEKDYGLTYQTIKMLNTKGIHYLIVTKSDMVASDKYLEILDKKLAHIQISISSTNDDIALKYEKAPLVSKRIEAIEKLYKLNYDVQLRLSPFIYEYIDKKILNSIAVDKILVEFLRVNSFIRKWFNQIDLSQYTVKHSNYWHLPLEIKKKQLEIITNFSQISICEDVDTDYEYWVENVNYNKNNCCNLRI